LPSARPAAKGEPWQGWTALPGGVFGQGVTVTPFFDNGAETNLFAVEQNGLVYATRAPAGQSLPPWAPVLNQVFPQSPTHNVSA
jgi:hypothetical protein